MPATVFTAALPEQDFRAICALAGFEPAEVFGEERDSAYCLRTRFAVDLAAPASRAFVSWLSGETYVVQRSRPR